MASEPVGSPNVPLLALDKVLSPGDGSAGRLVRTGSQPRSVYWNLRVPELSGSPRVERDLSATTTAASVLASKTPTDATPVAKSKSSLLSPNVISPGQETVTTVDDERAADEQPIVYPRPPSRINPYDGLRACLKDKRGIHRAQVDSVLYPPKSVLFQSSESVTHSARGHAYAPKQLDGDNFFVEEDIIQQFPLMTRDKLPKLRQDSKVMAIRSIIRGAEGLKKKLRGARMKLLREQQVDMEKVFATQVNYVEATDDLLSMLERLSKFGGLQDEHVDWLIAQLPKSKVMGTHDGPSMEELEAEVKKRIREERRKERVQQKRRKYIFVDQLSSFRLKQKKMMGAKTMANLIAENSARSPQASSPNRKLDIGSTSSTPDLLEPGCSTRSGATTPLTTDSFASDDDGAIMMTPEQFRKARETEAKAAAEEKIRERRARIRERKIAETVSGSGRTPTHQGASRRARFETTNGTTSKSSMAAKKERPESAGMVSLSGMFSDGALSQTIYDSSAFIRRIEDRTPRITFDEEEILEEIKQDKREQVEAGEREDVDSEDEDVFAGIPIIRKGKLMCHAPKRPRPQRPLRCKSPQGAFEPRINYKHESIFDDISPPRRDRTGDAKSPRPASRGTSPTVLESARRSHELYEDSLRTCDRLMESARSYKDEVGKKWRAVYRGRLEAKLEEFRNPNTLLKIVDGLTSQPAGYVRTQHRPPTSCETERGDGHGARNIWGRMRFERIERIKSYGEKKTFYDNVMSVCMTDKGFASADGGLEFVRILRKLLADEDVVLSKRVFFQACVESGRSIVMDNRLCGFFIKIRKLLGISSFEMHAFEKHCGWDLHTSIATLRSGSLAKLERRLPVGALHGSMATPSTARAHYRILGKAPSGQYSFTDMMKADALRTTPRSARIAGARQRESLVSLHSDVVDSFVFADEIRGGK